MLQYMGRTICYCHDRSRVVIDGVRRRAIGVRWDEPAKRRAVPQVGTWRRWPWVPANNGPKGLWPSWGYVLSFVRGSVIQGKGLSVETQRLWLEAHCTLSGSKGLVSGIPHLPSIFDVLCHSSGLVAMKPVGMDPLVARRFEHARG